MFLILQFLQTSKCSDGQHPAGSYMELFPYLPPADGEIQGNGAWVSILCYLMSKHIQMTAFCIFYGNTVAQNVDSETSLQLGLLLVYFPISCGFPAYQPFPLVTLSVSMREPETLFLALHHKPPGWCYASKFRSCIIKYLTSLIWNEFQRQENYASAKDKLDSVCILMWTYVICIC